MDTSVACSYEITVTVEPKEDVLTNPTSNSASNTINVVVGEYPCDGSLSSQIVEDQEYSHIYNVNEDAPFSWIKLFVNS